MTTKEVEEQLRKLKVNAVNVNVRTSYHSQRKYAIFEIRGEESREKVERRIGRVIEKMYRTKLTKFQKYEGRRERAMREGGQNLVRERERREEESRKIIIEKERENEEKFACGSQNHETYGPWYQEKSVKKQAPPRQQQENHGPWHKGNMNDFFHQVGLLLRKLNLDPVTSTTPASTSLTSSTSAPFPYKLTTARYANGWGSSSRNPARF